MDLWSSINSCLPLCCGQHRALQHHARAAMPATHLIRPWTGGLNSLEIILLSSCAFTGGLDSSEWGFLITWLGVKDLLGVGLEGTLIVFCEVVHIVDQIAELVYVIVVCLQSR